MTRRGFLAATLSGPAFAQNAFQKTSGLSPMRLKYGTDRFQFGDLRLPAGAGPHPAVIVLHGGLWINSVTLEQMTAFCETITRAGVATWNMEYRRLGDMGGGWTGTFDDVLHGSEYLAKVAPQHRLDLNRVVAVGPSSGGHLALWLAAQRAVELQGVVGLAPVSDLRRGWALRLGNGAIGRLLGGSPEQVPQRYGASSPIELVPISVKQRIVHGTADEIVPLSMSDAFARSSHNCALTPVQGARHFDLIDPRGTTWPSVEKAILNW